MMNTFEHNKSILKSINSFNLLEKTRYEAPRDIKQTHILASFPQENKGRLPASGKGA